MYVGMGAGLLLLLAIMGSAYLLGQQNSANKSPAATAPAAFTLRGELQIRDDYTGWRTGSDCAGLRGYGDIRKGAQVSVTDSTGRVMAIGLLSSGKVTDFSPFKYCVLAFAVDNVPLGAGIYGVEAAHRGRVQFNESDAKVGNVVLTLG